MIVVEQVTGLALLQDPGRPGHARLGVAPSGAFDVGAHLAADAAVGNAPGAATIELLLGPLVLRARRACVLAVTGAGGDVRVDGLAVAPRRPFTLVPGAVLTVGAARDGVRRYVAVRGGFAVEPVLGSRARDTLAELGPAPLASGDELPVGDDVATPLRPPVPAAGAATVGVAKVGSAEAGDAGARPPTEVLLEVLPGPRPEDFATDALGDLASQVWTVSDRCDRVAVRLEGARVHRATTGVGGPAGDRPSPELPSEGLVAGAVQVPPSGEPVVMGPDHPLTGGYPVVAALTRASLDRLAQVRPGTRVRLVPTTVGPSTGAHRSPVPR
ncbi:5-oxoprolinase subunit C family protein [Serinibacter arcticus]|uniref:Allophanate hydrolase 2 subunit 2 n=1 Tax=Serinibacter arcticus TaxID=1655435 RepID=A0A4Z1E034_9MICO|nr:biotin-dependent carboxyltransferase family protein [Serinibacter arcticus]TGO03972.1 Allophanate hydrolase 2 subunit 2 [Serinibacter arcticus]